MIDFMGWALHLDRLTNALALLGFCDFNRSVPILRKPSESFEAGFEGLSYFGLLAAALLDVRLPEFERRKDVDQVLPLVGKVASQDGGRMPPLVDFKAFA